jgi:hypothetical protein
VAQGFRYHTRAMRDEAAYADLLLTARAHIEERYGLTVSFRDVPEPFFGDLDGAEIRIDPAQSAENGFFSLLHLFGHTVQWNTDARSREVGVDVSIPLPEAQVEEIVAFEREAARYGLQILHDLGVTDLDGWYCDFSAADLDYLAHYYRTGEKRSLPELWRPGREVLSPLAIPPFQPTRWNFRWRGVVI